MLKKIYKNNGFIYISNINNIDYNNKFINNYQKHSNLTIKEIECITKKELYGKVGCKY